MRALLVVVSALGLGAVVGAVVVGTRTFDGTVVRHPYEHGLDWDRQQARRRESGLAVRLRETRFGAGTARVAFTIDGPASAGPDATDVAVRARRPATAEHEREVPARRGADGVWDADVEFPAAGRWELDVLVRRGGERLEFPAPVVVTDAPRGTPAAAAACDLNRGPCGRPLPGGGGTISLEMAPRPVRTMEELEFTVRVACDAAPCRAQATALALTMPGMYMGENTVALAPGGPAGTFRGRGTIVRCPSGRRLWRATVRVPPLGEVAFEFETDRP